MEQKTVFFIISNRVRISTMLRTDMFSLLQKRGVRIVILSRFGADETFIKEFSGTHVHFEPLGKSPSGFLVSASMRIRDTLLKYDDPELSRTLHTLRNIRTGRVVGWRMRDAVLRRLRQIAHPLLPTITRMFTIVERILFANKNYAELFRLYKPSAVLLGTLGSEMEDVVFISHADTFGVPTIVADLPWSYVDNRMFSHPRTATRIIAWNEQMKEQLVASRGIPADAIAVAGTARFDHYAGAAPAMSREECITMLGGNPHKKLITYALVDDEWHPRQEHVVEWLLDMISQNAFGAEAQLLVRAGPKQQKLELYKKRAAEHPELLLDDPTKLSDQARLTSILSASDLLISVGSSLALDAAILARPMLYLGFTDPERHDPFDPILAQMYEQPFLVRAIATSGIRVAKSGEEFRTLATAALQSAASEETGRKKLIAEFLSGGMGGGKRIAEEIMRVIS